MSLATIPPRAAPDLDRYELSYGMTGHVVIPLRSLIDKNDPRAALNPANLHQRVYRPSEVKDARDLGLYSQARESAHILLGGGGRPVPLFHPEPVRRFRVRRPRRVHPGARGGMVFDEARLN